MLSTQASKLNPKPSHRIWIERRKTRIPEPSTDEKEKSPEKTCYVPAEPVKGKECPRCGKLTVVRTAPNAGWIRFECLSCDWKKDIYTGF